MTAHGNGAWEGLTTEELRAAVRAVLLDVLPPDVRQAGGSDEVALHTDADLDVFVRRVAALCEDPSQRAALRDGRRAFRLARPQKVAGATTPTRTSGGSTVQRIEQGAITERAVQKAAADGVRLSLGRRAVLTPLARDKARILGVEIEKER
jgi:IS5 family transposase